MRLNFTYEYKVWQKEDEQLLKTKFRGYQGMFLNNLGEWRKRFNKELQDKIGIPLATSYKKDYKIQWLGCAIKLVMKWSITIIVTSKSGRY